MVTHKRSKVTVNLGVLHVSDAPREIRITMITQLCGKKVDGLPQDKKPPRLTKSWDEVTCSRCMSMRNVTSRLEL